MKQVKIQIPSLVENIRVVESFIDNSKDTFQIEDDIYGNIMVAVTEAVNNAIRHGNKFDKDKNVYLSLYVEPQQLKFEIEDEGTGFNYDNLDDPTAPENLENPGALDLLKKHNSDGFGIPVWFIFDTDGKLLVDSHLRPEGVGMDVKGKNIIGCPASKEEVEAFVKALKLTTKLNDAELSKIFARFRQNDPAFKAPITNKAK